MSQNENQAGRSLLFNSMLDMLELEDQQVQKAFSVFRGAASARDAFNSFKSLQTRMQALVTLRDQVLIRGILAEAEAKETSSDELPFDQEALDHLLENVLNLLEGATRTSGNFSHTLNEAIEELKLARDMVSLKSLSNSLINTSNNMMAATREFQNNIGGMALALIEQQDRIKSLENELETQKNAARHDDLTGILNRGSFDRDFGKQVDRALRFKTPLCMMLVDLDHFKNINDTHGHKVGDDVLVSFSELLLRIMAPNPVYRYGGDEFVVLFPNCSLEKAEKLGADMDIWVARHQYSNQNASFKLTFSAGLSQLQTVDDKGKFFTRVDGLLYKAKLNGRGQICSG